MRTTNSLLLLCGLGISALAGCTGSDGKNGADGLPGATGQQGPAGPPGPAGEAGAQGPQGEAGPPGPASDGGIAVLPEGGLTSSCLSPCHGFTGIVEQWKTSTHYATYIANLGGEEVASWTGSTACGNCHAIDGIEQRLLGNVNHLGTTGPTNVTEGEINYLNSVNNRATEATYAGHASVAVVHCTTCHQVDATNDPHRTGQNYTPGSFPLRVPTDSTTQARIEKSTVAGTVDGTPVGAYGKGNACIWCHKSRKDVTNYIAASPTTTNINSGYWGPHEGPQSDVFTGKGGYHFAGRTYNPSTHQSLANGCVDCHMPSVATNSGVGDHSFYPKMSACVSCHVGATNFNINNGQSNMLATIQELRVALNNLGCLTRTGTTALSATELADTHLAEDKTWSSNSGGLCSALTADQAGALYNYLLLARGSAKGAHNPKYTQQLAFDSVFALTGAAPLTLTTRPGP